MKWTTAFFITLIFCLVVGLIIGLIIWASKNLPVWVAGVLGFLAIVASVKSNFSEPKKD